MKNRLIDLLDRMTKNRARKTMFSPFFSHSDTPGIFQQITPPKKFGNFLAKLSAFYCHVGLIYTAVFFLANETFYIYAHGAKKMESLLEMAEAMLHLIIHRCSNRRFNLLHSRGGYPDIRRYPYIRRSE